MVTPDAPQGGTPVALLRHFPTDWNLEHRMQGRVDRPLAESSLVELAGLALPAPWDAARVIASPLIRAAQTAEALTGAPPPTDARLIELEWGEWEGKRGEDLLANPDSGFRHVEDWGWNCRPPGGESPQDAWDRLAPALTEIAADGRPTVLVVHRGLIRVILAKAWGWNFDRPEPFKIKKAKLCPILLDAGGAPHSPGEILPLVERAA